MRKLGYGNFNLSEVGRKFHDEEEEYKGTDPSRRRSGEGPVPINV